MKDVPKRAQAARDLGKKLGVEIKQVYLTSGESDLLIIVETANADNIPKFAMAIGSLGNLRTRTVRAWPEDAPRERSQRDRQANISRDLLAGDNLTLLSNTAVSAVEIGPDREKWS